MNRQFVIDRLPEQKLATDHFRLVETAMPQAADGELLLRTRYVSLDAANRAWMLGQTYRAGLASGQVMAGAVLAEVVESRAEGFTPGDIVYADTGWQTFATAPATQVRRTPPTQPLSRLLGVFGAPGLTAYFGLLECAPFKAGETVVVSAAAGAVGLMAGQIAKLKGARVVGIAGGAAKCALLTGTYGFDAAVDYKAAADGAALYGALQAACGGGIDVYFDNVGGATLDVCLFSMNENGRVAACGAVSVYDGTPPHGVRAMAGIVSKRVRIRGFIVTDFRDDYPRALADLREWVDDGSIKPAEEIIDAFDALPSALVGLLAGENVGKRMVRVVAD